MKFRKIPHIVEAWRVENSGIIPGFLREAEQSGIIEVVEYCPYRKPKRKVHIQIGFDSSSDDCSTVVVYEGDWIIKGIAGEYYPCKDDIFKKSYEAAQEEKVQVSVLDTLKALRAAIKAAERMQCPAIIVNPDTLLIEMGFSSDVIASLNIRDYIGEDFDESF